MENHKNCPNCAAPYDPALVRCPYCGTAYFDMSVIDFDHYEPFFLTIRTHGYIITQLVRPKSGKVEINTEYAEFRGGLGNGILGAIPVSVQSVTDLTFEAVVRDSEQPLYTAQKAEEE